MTLMYIGLISVSLSLFGLWLAYTDLEKRITKLENKKVKK